MLGVAACRTSLLIRWRLCACLEVLLIGKFISGEKKGNRKRKDGEEIRYDALRKRVKTGIWSSLSNTSTPQVHSFFFHISRYPYPSRPPFHSHFLFLCTFFPFLCTPSA